jgi:hypothetical protein
MYAAVWVVSPIPRSTVDGKKAVPEQTAVSGLCKNQRWHTGSCSAHKQGIIALLAAAKLLSYASGGRSSSIRAQATFL